MEKWAEIELRLRKLGKTREWLAAETGRSKFSVRDALAKGTSRKPMSAAMIAELEAALAKAEAMVTPPVGDILGEFTPAQRKTIAEHAAREGFGDSRGWIVAKVKAFLAMLGAKPGK